MLLADYFKLAKTSEDVFDLLIQVGFTEEDIRITSMFGCDFINIKNVQALVVFKGNIFIKKPVKHPVCNRLLALPHQSQMAQMFMCIPDNWTINDLLCLIDCGIKSKQEKKDKPNNSIRYMQNLTSKHESLIATFGVTTPNQLKLMGSINLFQKISIKNPNTPIALLLKIEGAIQGKQWKFIENTWITNAKKQLLTFRDQ